MPTPNPNPNPKAADTPYSAADDAALQTQTQPSAPAVVEEPQAGGCYTRDPVTGVLTLVTPSSTDNN